MTSSLNADLIRDLKKLVEEGKPLESSTRDRLLFTTIIDIYENMERMNKTFDEYRPLLGFYKTMMYFALAAGISIMGFMGALLTHQVDVVVK